MRFYNQSVLISMLLLLVALPKPNFQEIEKKLSKPNKIISLGTLIYKTTLDIVRYIAEKVPSTLNVERSWTLFHLRL